MEFDQKFVFTGNIKMLHVEKLLCTMHNLIIFFLEDSKLNVKSLDRQETELNVD